jgi:tetratricopeptide (TPR) repeat protein
MHRAALIISAGLAGMAGCNDAVEQPLSAPYQQALRHLEQRDLPAALSACQAAVLLQPTSLPSRRLLGFLLASAGQSAQAIDVFRAALDLDPACAVVHNDLACAYADQDKYQQALVHLEEARRLASGLAFIHYNLGALLEHLGRSAESETAYLQARQLDPRDVKTLQALGRAELRRSRLEPAEAFLRQALELGPRDGRAHCEMAHFLMLRQRYAEAAEYFQWAAALSPRLHEAHYGLSQACARLGLRDRSEAALREFHRLGPPPHPQALMVLSDPRRQYPQDGADSPGPAAPGPTAPAADWGRFTEVTDQAGLRFVHTSGAAGNYYMPEIMGAGLCFLDYDGDGLQDLFLVNGHALPRPGPSPPTDALYRNQGDGTFADRTAAARLRDRGYGMGCAAGDYDGDGDLDLYVSHFGADALYRNDRGAFTEVADQMGASDSLWSSSAAFLDYDGDGDLDLYAANYLDFSLERNLICGKGAIRDYCNPVKYRGVPDALYRNDGDHFADATRPAGVFDPEGKGLGVATGDCDRDGDVDLYVANDGTANRLYRNEGKGFFSEVGVASGTAYDPNGLAEAGMGTAFGDYDGDGYPDLVVTNFVQEGTALYHNNRDGTFTDQSGPAGLEECSLPFVGFGTFFFDCDNDADLDLFVANGHILANVEQWDEATTFAQPCQLFLNHEGRFADASSASGSCLVSKQVGRGAAACDWDGDGDLDLALSANNGPARLLRNDGGNRNRWLQVRLLGRTSGARLEVEAAGRTQVREYGASASYLSGGEEAVHFGLGTATSANLRVYWPGGAEQHFPGLPADQRLTLVEGSAQPQVALRR